MPDAEILVMTMNDWELRYDILHDLLTALDFTFHRHTEEEHNGEDEYKVIIGFTVREPANRGRITLDWRCLTCKFIYTQAKTLNTQVEEAREQYRQSSWLGTSLGDSDEPSTLLINLLSPPFPELSRDVILSVLRNHTRNNPSPEPADSEGTRPDTTELDPTFQRRYIDRNPPRRNY